MQSVLEEFAHGNISPIDRSFCRDSEYGHAMQGLTDTESTVLAALGADKKELMDSYINAWGKVSDLSATSQFIYGYRLGVLMMVEVFTGAENLLAGAEGC